MLYMKGGYWVDLDMIAIKRFNFTEPYIFSSERTMLKGSLIFKDKRKQIANRCFKSLKGFALLQGTL